MVIFFILHVNLADAVGPRAFAYVEQQGAGTASKVEHARETLLLPGLGFLTIEGDDGGEDVGNLLRGIELPSLLARPAANCPIRYS